MGDKYAGKTIKDPEIYKLTRHRDQRFLQAAALILVLPEEQKKTLLKDLASNEIEGVLAAIKEIGSIDKRAVKKLAQEFDLPPETLLDSAEGGDAAVAEIKKLLIC